MIKQRLLTGWNFARILYLIMGILVIASSIAEDQWLGILLGGYITSMGLFAFGCAAGSCFNDSCSVKPEEDHKN